MVVQREKTLLQGALGKLSIAVLLLCLACCSHFASSRPIGDDKGVNEQVSQGEALAPKSTTLLNSEAMAADNARQPLSPALQDTRKLWNRAKRMHRLLQPKRYVRNVESNPATGVPGNVSVPKYILELYNNLTEETATGILQQKTTRANTVRSLDADINEPSNCELFNFSLSSINSSEFIVKAELHLYLNRQVESTSNSIHVDIRLTNPVEGQPPVSVVSTDVALDDKNQQKYIFDVSGVLGNLIRNKRRAEFLVKIYKDAASKDSIPPAPLSCEQIHFIQSTNTNQDTEPQLIVHTYDTELEKFDYKWILDRLNSSDTDNRSRRSAALSSAMEERRRRQTTEAITDNKCNLYSLNITNTEIVIANEAVLLPFHYNAGICGGGCGHSLPVNQELRHNFLVHMLQGTNAFRDRHSYNITRCCAPIKYGSLDAIVSSSTSSKPYFRIIPNMRITQCECLEIVDFN